MLYTRPTTANKVGYICWSHSHIGNTYGRSGIQLKKKQQTAFDLSVVHTYTTENVESRRNCAPMSGWERDSGSRNCYRFVEVCVGCLRSSHHHRGEKSTFSALEPTVGNSERKQRTVFILGVKFELTHTSVQFARILSVPSACFVQFRAQWKTRFWKLRNSGRNERIVFVILSSRVCVRNGKNLFALR